MRKILFALALVLVPMLCLSAVVSAQAGVGTGSIPVHAQEMQKVAEFPFPAAEETMFWGEEEKIISATKYIKRLREAPAIATVITAEQSDLL